MADRRPISSRLWSLATSLTPRRNAATRSSENTTSSPTPPPKVEPQNNSQSTATATNATSTNPPVAEIETQTSRSTKTTTAASRPPTASAQATTPPSSEAELQTNSQSTVSNTTTTSTDPSIMEIKIPTSPSTTTTTTRPPIVVAQPTTPPSGEVLTDGPNTNTTIDTSQNPPKVETQTSAGQSNITPTPTPPAFIPPPTIPPSTVVQTANQSTFNASARPTDDPEPKPQTTSQYRATTQSPSSSKPASPSRRTTQSKPLSQPSSPSRAAPQARFTPSSPSRAGSQIPLTPQRPSQPRSPSRLASNSPKRSPTSTKGTQSTSPSKESLSTNQEISNVDEAPVELASNEKEPKTAASQEEALETQPKEDVKSDNNDERTPLVESNAKPEETKEVKEVVQAANTETNKETNKEANDFLASKSGSRAQIIEKVEHLSKPDEKQDALDTKEILPISLPNVKPNSQPKKITMISNTYKKSALPSGENVPLHKEIKEHISPFVNKIAIGDPKLAIYEKRAGVITLAGENRGALMEVGSNSSKREEPVHIHRGYKTNPDESTEATTDEEESSKGKKSDDGRATIDQPTEAYLNNNAQGINNSIVFNSSVAERNPGIHMVVNHVQKELIELTDKSRGVETRKAEFNISHAEKLTYEPTVRRRCLKGLFLETSDSDQENSEKPRRHGCRVGCKEKDKEKNIDVL